MRHEGLQFRSNVPLIQLEYYFPDIDDPRLLMTAMVDFRHEFDMKNNEKLEELVKYRNGNTVCHHIIGKKTVVAPRDCVEKRIFFQAQ